MNQHIKHYISRSYHNYGQRPSSRSSPAGIAAAASSASAAAQELSCCLFKSIAVLGAIDRYQLLIALNLVHDILKAMESQLPSCMQ
jgi:hypothetical protein